VLEKRVLQEKKEKHKLSKSNPPESGLMELQNLKKSLDKNLTFLNSLDNF